MTTLEDKVTQLEQTNAELVSAAQGLTGEVTGKVEQINQQVDQAEQEFNSWKEEFMEVINGVTVHKQGRLKQYFLRGYMETGGFVSEGGPDSQFPLCANPQPPFFLNLLEFDAQAGFGEYGDMFRIEYVQSHRGMFHYENYPLHLIFTGTSQYDSVGGQLEIKKVAGNGLSVFISEPESDDQEIAITTDMEGSTIPIAFRNINKGYDSGIARITLKVDSRYHCGANRSFGAHVLYTSSRGRPSTSPMSQTQPVWNQ